MSRPRAADDFKTIRTRLEELRRARQNVQQNWLAGVCARFDLFDLS